MRWRSYRSMTLRIVTALAGAKVGGAEAFFVTLTAALARAGVSVHAILKPNAQRQDALTLAGVEHSLAPFGKFLDFETGRVFRRVAAAFRPDAVLAFAGRAATKAPRGDYALVGRLGGYYNLQNFHKCDALICNAPDLVRYTVEGGWQKERVFHVPNFPGLDVGEAVSRESLGTPQNVPLALALGRLHRNKALDVLIKAAARIPNLWVWIAGEGPEREALEVLATELGVSTRIRFLGWRQDRASLFKAADFCVYPSREEPFGNVVVEAWGYGLPLIAAASTGPRWLIRDREDALLTPVDDVDALTEAMHLMIVDRDLRARLALAGHARVAADFSEASIIRRYVEILSSVRR